MVMPWIAALAYLFRSVALVRIAESAGMALTTSLTTMLLGVATLTLRPERNPVAWMRSRLNRGSCSGWPAFSSVSRSPSGCSCAC